jgi:hypothetical protein
MSKSISETLSAHHGPLAERLRAAYAANPQIFEEYRQDLPALLPKMEEICDQKQIDLTALKTDEDIKAAFDSLKKDLEEKEEAAKKLKETEKIASQKPEEAKPTKSSDDDDINHLKEQNSALLKENRELKKKYETKTDWKGRIATELLMVALSPQMYIAYKAAKLALGYLNKDENKPSTSTLTPEPTPNNKTAQDLAHSNS